MKEKWLRVTMLWVALRTCWSGCPEGVVSCRCHANCDEWPEMKMKTEKRVAKINQFQNNDLSHPNSDTGSARNPLLSGKLLGVREITAPPVTRDLPTTVRAKLRFTVS